MSTRLRVSAAARPGRFPLKERQMPTKLFVNLPVKDLGRSKTFFTDLGLAFYGMTDDMASVIISEHTQVMLLTEAAFAGYARTSPTRPRAPR
jgi:uncharacterized protein